MKKTYIFGIGTVGLLIKSFIDEMPGQYDFCGFVVDDDYFKNQEGCFSWTSFKKNENKDDVQLLIGVGYQHLNADRENIIKKITGEGFEIANFIHPKSFVAKSAIIGRGNLFFPGSIVEPFAKLGDGNILWSNSSVCHHSVLGNYNFLACSSVVLGKTMIGNNCFFGSNCTVKNRLVVKDFSFIGANVFLHENTEKYDVYLQNKAYKIDKKSFDMKI